MTYEKLFAKWESLTLEEQSRILDDASAPGTKLVTKTSGSHGITLPKAIVDAWEKEA